MLVRNNLYLLLIAFVSTLVSCNSDISNNPDHIAWADSIVERANDMMSTGNPLVGLEFVDSVFNHTPDLGVGDVWRKYNSKLNYYTNYDRDLVKREQYVDSLLILLEGKETQYKFEYAQTLFGKGKLLRDGKKYNLAFKHYFDGRKFAQKNLDKCSLSDFSNSLGIILYQQGDYKKSIGYLKQAFQENQECDSANFHYDFVLPQSILNTTALCYEKAKNLDSAVFFYTKAHNFISEQGKKYPERAVFVSSALGVVEGNLGGTYAQLGNFKEAEKHLKTNISINDQPQHPIEDSQTAKLKLAQLYIDNNALPQANSLLDQLQSDLYSGRGKSSYNNEIWTKWYRLKWIYNDKVGDLSEAYHYLDRYHIFKDSLDHINSDLKHADMDQVFAEHEHQYQLSLLKKGNELKTVYLVALIIFLVMAVVIALVIGYYLRRSRKNVKELTALNQQAKTTLSALENSQRENSRMLKIVSHDLRNPIGAMTAMADLLLEDSGRPEDERTALELMKISGENSLKLVNDLLQINVPQFGEMKKEPQDIEEIIRYCIDMLQHKAQEKGQQIKLDTKPIILPLNYEKMWRVISNLVFNAIKFSPVGSRIYIGLEQVGKRVLVRVKDSGIGIPDELKDKVFDQFTTARRPGTSGEESSGLGLAISKQIVETHGGKLSFEKNPDAGTTFIIELPLE